MNDIERQRAERRERLLRELAREFAIAFAIATACGVLGWWAGRRSER